MKVYVLFSLLVAMFFPAMVFGGEHGEARERQEDIERQMHLRRMQLEMEEQEAERDFHHSMRELDLKERRLALERKHKAQKLPKHIKCHCGEKMAPLVIIYFVLNILLAVWVFQDIRRRNCGSGIWIVIVLLAGLLGVLPYAIVRLGDSRETK
jgi:hypothetical protein